MTHPSQTLDELIHQRVRLGLLAVLSEADRAEFTHLRDLLGLTDGNLNRHLSVLEEAGYVEIHKGAYEGKRSRTWVVATRSGRRALAGYLDTLQEIIHRVGDTT